MAQGSARFVAFALGLACAGCSIAPAPVPVIANYDFGPAPAGHSAQGPRQALLVHDVSAPAWLDSRLIHYRLAYRDATRPQVYAESRWVMSPAALLTNRLRGQLAASGSGGIVQPGDGARAGYALRVELDEFTQVFDAPGKSRAVVRLRASVLGNRSLVAQRSFSVERPAKTPDAEGGVRALIAAGDEAIDQLIGWAVPQLKD
jgi:cholesterol transport system auxiliary component